MKIEALQQNNPLYNRIKKNLKALKSYIAKEKLSCYRVFDWDMPEFPFCIDKYEQWVHIAEYKTKHQMEKMEHEQWLTQCLLTIREVLQVDESMIFMKTRARQKGLAQYEKLDEKKEFVQVSENGLSFLVNLNDYLDTGLFLDHRITRKWVRDQASEKQVLNLFAYTGSFSVYAGAGGAKHVTTVDLSNTYLQWAKENVKANHLSLDQHTFIKADVKEWIKDGPSNFYDLVILDPPTSSRSKMSKSSFDIQTDHPELIHHVLKQMKPGGLLYFSTNFREFQLNHKRIQASKLTDVSLQSIPDDFRNKKIHYCWQIEK